MLGGLRRCDGAAREARGAPDVLIATSPWERDRHGTHIADACRVRYVRAVAAAAALFGIVLMRYAIRTADEGVGPIAQKKQIAHWLETSLWVDPRYMAVGAVIALAVAVLWLFICRRSGRDLLLSGSLVVASAIGFFFAWAAAFHRGNLTRSWPQ
jgi:hypothetical protein